MMMEPGSPAVSSGVRTAVKESEDRVLTLADVKGSNSDPAWSEVPEDLYFVANYAAALGGDYPPGETHTQTASTSMREAGRRGKGHGDDGRRRRAVSHDEARVGCWLVVVVAENVDKSYWDQIKDSTYQKLAGLAKSADPSTISPAQYVILIESVVRAVSGGGTDSGLHVV